LKLPPLATFPSIQGSPLKVLSSMQSPIKVFTRLPSLRDDLQKVTNVVIVNSAAEADIVLLKYEDPLFSTDSKGEQDSLCCDFRIINI
jgi:predicted Zn-dependent protease